MGLPMKVVLEVTFRAGGVVFRGTRWEDGALVFEFERPGELALQAITSMRVEAEVEEPPKKVLVELRTKEGGKVFEAFERDGRYLAMEP